MIGFVRNLIEAKKQKIFLSSLKVGQFKESFSQMNAENIRKEEQRLFLECMEQINSFKITSNYEASFCLTVENANFTIKLPSKKQIPYSLALQGIKKTL